MNLPIWEEGFYGNLSYFYDTSKYSIDKFKEDFEDFVKYREQIKAKRDE